MRMLRSRSARNENSSATPAAPVSVSLSTGSGTNSRAMMQTITPEEPGKLEYGLAFGDAAALQSRDGSCRDVLKEELAVEDEKRHSLQNTRLLELEIAKMVADLEQSRPRTDETAKLIALFNKSLSAISHWSLQAQLSHWGNKKETDERFNVEKSLVKKEAEYFKNKLLESEHLHRQNLIQRSPVSVSTPAVAGKGIFPATSPPRASTITAPSLLSPKRVTKQRKIMSPRRKNTHNHAPTSTLKLVENTKPHPRLKRNLNDQTNQELIRVFHLEKGQ